MTLLFATMLVDIIIIRFIEMYGPKAGGEPSTALAEAITKILAHSKILNRHSNQRQQISLVPVGHG
jgi:hypothetical protein